MAEKKTTKETAEKKPATEKAEKKTAPKTAPAAEKKAAPKAAAAKKETAEKKPAAEKSEKKTAPKAAPAKEKAKLETAIEEEVVVDDLDDEVMELVSEEGETKKFYHEATVELNGEYYAILSPAEKIEGIDEDEAEIFLLADDEENEGELLLLHVTDEELRYNVFNEYERLLEGGCGDEEEGGGCGGGCGGCAHKCK